VVPVEYEAAWAPRVWAFWRKAKSLEVCAFVGSNAAWKAISVPRSRKVFTGIPFYASLGLKRKQISCTSRRKPEITHGNVSSHARNKNGQSNTLLETHFKEANGETKDTLGG